MKYIARLLPHIQLILAGMLITFCIIDFMNSAMAFINNDATKTLILISALLSMINAGMLIGYQRRGRRK